MAPLIMSLPFFDFDNTSWTTSLLATALFVSAVHLVPYVVDVRRIRTIPGPWLAKYTDAWLWRVVAGGHRSDVVHELHKKYGEHLLRTDYLRLLESMPGPDRASSVLQEPSSDSLQTMFRSLTQTHSKSSMALGAEA